MKSKVKITRADYLKAMRKARRDEEIREHLHPVNINRVHKSKKVYNRKRNKADLNKDLPYFFAFGKLQASKLQVSSTFIF